MLFLVGSERCVCNEMHNGCSRSSKIVHFVTSSKRVCNFLFGNNSNVDPILRRVKDFMYFDIVKNCHDDPNVRSLGMFA